MFSKDSEHRIRSVEKNAPAREPRSRNWEIVRRSFGEGFNRRLYAVKISYYQLEYNNDVPEVFSLYY